MGEQNYILSQRNTVWVFEKNFNGWEYGPAVGFEKHDREPSGSIKDRKFLDHTSYQSASLDVLRNTTLKKKSRPATTMYAPREEQI